MASLTVMVGTGPLTFADVCAVARGGAAVRLAADAYAALDAAQHIEAPRRAPLQRSSGCLDVAGTGAEAEADVVRGMMLLRLSALATGRTGARAETAERLADLLTAHITPVVREFGRLGRSGDLAPLAHWALALMGEGEVRDATGALLPAAEALNAAGLRPVEPSEKECLSLGAGADGMLAQLVLAVTDLRRLLKTLDIAAAMSAEAVLGTDRAFAPELQAPRRHPGQAASAANLVAVMAGSGVADVRRGPERTRLQDAYSIRCSPQVHGAARDTVEHAAAVAGRELRAAVGDPAVLLGAGRVDGDSRGASVAHTLDFLAIVAADVASISERRTGRFLDPARNGGLPAFLADSPGSGCTIAQYTQAATVSELKRLAAPAPADSGAIAEEHASTGWGGARRLRRAVDGLTRVVAIELLTAARALDLRAPLKPAPATGAVLELLRSSGVPGPGPDRYLAPEIDDTVSLVGSGAVVGVVEGVAGALS